MSTPTAQLVSPTPVSASARVRAAYARLAQVDRPEVWITLFDEADALAAARVIDDRVAAGEHLPLAGTVIAIKDNIDIAGIPTTAGCPEYAYTPAESAGVIERVISAGAVIIGKTNLDQFATGLVGTRSPYGAVRNAHHPEFISGGSSSGSAVAVALGIVDVALGTDTAGSGRVPAALNGIVGVKPTLGLVSAHGVVPACADYDTVAVFAETLPLAATTLAVISGADPRDPRSRQIPADISLGTSRTRRLLIPAPHQLDLLTPAYREAWQDTVSALRAVGMHFTEVDIAPLLDAARLLYEGAIVAERYSAVGEFINQERTAAGLDPTVASIVNDASTTLATDFIADLEILRVAQRYAESLFADHDGMVLPTTTEHPSLAAVHADPIEINRRLGSYTNFCNLLDLCSVAVPGLPTRSAMPFGVMAIAPSFADQVALDLANGIAAVCAPGIAGEVALPPAMSGALPLAVFGAHRRGEPLHHELEDIRARYAEDIETTDAYRLFALDTEPPKPGVVRVAPGAGESIVGELYMVSPAGLGRFLAQLPTPMSLTAVELTDGRTVTGFSCTHNCLAGATDITTHRDWLKYLSAKQ